MKHIVTVDSIFETMRLEALVSGADQRQVDAIRYLESISEKDEETYNPYRRAEMDVTFDGVNLRIFMTEADTEGNLIANGEWCRITVYPHGDMSMTTSHDPEFAHTFEVTGYN